MFSQNNFDDGSTKSEHGTEATYGCGCRCDICKSGKRNRQAIYQKNAHEHFAKTGNFLSPKAQHGTYSAYVYYGCRCELCSAANLSQTKKTCHKMRAAFKQTGQFANSDKHGTRYGYVTLGCRCEACSKAHSEYQKERRAKRKIKNL